jgi:DNA-binding NtrC family response regulator
MNASSSPTVLLVDSSARSREEKHYGLTQRGYHVIAVETGDRGLNALASEPVEVLISELHAPGIDGIRLMNVALRRRPETGVILMAVPGSTALAVTAMKAGAYDVLEQPVYVEKLAAEIDKILERQRIVQANADLQRQLEARYGFENIIGKSASMQRIRDQILQIADTQATVLVYGESGTGKGLVAHALHMNSSRKDQPFVPLACSALSEGVIESELFGHERGAFTSAVKTHKGRFELADGGTLFLDEVGELTPTTQVKLLRVLQERKFERVGGTQTLKTDVRLIAATNRNLEEEVAKGRFREDLYYRLKVVTLTVPPLRERKEDLPLLIDHFIRRFSEREGKPIERMDRRAFELMMTYRWPGNVRELENCIEGMIVMASGSILTEDDVPEYIRHPQNDPPAAFLPPETPREALAPDLIRALIMTVAAQRGVAIKGITEDTLQRLAGVDWRRTGGSLRRCIDMMVLLADHPVLNVTDIPPEYRTAGGNGDRAAGNGNAIDIRVGMSIDEAERRLILATLESCGYNKARTARTLKIGLRTLFRKLKAYDLEA